jgi:Fe-Mn family superoxide dismutase
MSLRLVPLPYPVGSLAPHISADTLREHHGRHQRAYVKRVNQMVSGTPREDWPLDRLVREADGPLADQAAQAWNHEFYFRGLLPGGTGRPQGRLLDAIEAAFGGLPQFKREFTQAAVQHFGSGWAWLAADARGRLSLSALHDAGTPLRAGLRPVLACDVWEHAYYLDRRHDRAAYVRAFWRLVDWEVAAHRLQATYVSRASPAAERAASYTRNRV